LIHYLPSILQLDPRSVTLVAVGSVLLIAALAIQASGRHFKLPPLWLCILFGAWLIDLFFAGTAPDGSRARWMANLLRSLPGRENVRFLLLPPASSLSYPDVVARVDLPLGTLNPRAPQDGVTLSQWESSSVFLPAGQYQFLEDLDRELLFCNGEGCLTAVGSENRFTTGVNLSHFRVRAGSAAAFPIIKVAKLEISSTTAKRSLQLASGVRLHSLDDNAYWDPKGFWIHGGSRAEFAIEGRGPTTLSLANGAEENWVDVVTNHETLQFALRPRTAKRLTVALENGITFLAVEAASGFRPADLDPETEDRRLLGVFLTSPRD
jgi:hypothetical protein